jgi:hypothetical protein
MGLLGKILLNEGITIFRCDVLIKTAADQNKVEIYNEIRALNGVVVVTIEHSDFLDTKATQQYEYSLLKLKYIGRGDAKSSIKEIGIDAVTKNRIPGLLQFIPRYNTIIKVGSY